MGFDFRLNSQVPWCQLYFVTMRVSVKSRVKVCVSVFFLLSILINMLTFIFLQLLNCAMESSRIYSPNVYSVFKSTEKKSSA